jgi:toxin-antitoxin system PIN domain toxin
VRRTKAVDHTVERICLLDANLLLALTVDSHIHHGVAQQWFARACAGKGNTAAESGRHAETFTGFATCPITEGSLLRLRMSLGASDSYTAALAVLQAVRQHPKHRFWPDSLNYSEVPLRGIQSHRQVTDAYLAALARHHGGRLATLDRGLAALHADVAEWVGTAP